MKLYKRASFLLYGTTLLANEDLWEYRPELARHSRKRYASYREAVICLRERAVRTTARESQYLTEVL